MRLLPVDESGFRGQLAELDRLRVSLEAEPLVIEWRSRLACDLIAEAVQASTSMEGIPVTVEDVRRILAGDRPATVTPEDAAFVTGYREAMTYCQRRADDDVFTWSPELIKSIQDKVLAGRKDLGAGRYGKTRFVQDSKTGELIFTPPQEGIPELVEELCERMNSWNAHPALRSAWVHVALAAVHPFKDGNGRTARVLASLAMYRGGFNRPEFTSLEEWWGRHIDEYRAAFTCLGRTFHRGADVTPFIAAHVSAQVRQVYMLQDVQASRRRIFDGLNALIGEGGLPDRTFVALWDAFWERTITRPYYAATAGVTPNTATKDLDLLVKSRLLAGEGRTRGRLWRTGPAFFPALGRQFGIRPDDSGRDTIIAVVTREAVAQASRVHRQAQTTVSSPGEDAQTTATFDPAAAARIVRVAGSTTTRPAGD